MMLKDRELKTIKAEKIRQSALLPPRCHGLEVSASVERMGIQQPLIVRPILNTTDEYEIIDGRGRLPLLKGDQQILVDIRYNIKDSGVFKVSEATFQRKGRSAYEKALLYAKWMEILKREKGTDDGIQLLLAKETNLSEAAISQYIAIYNLFKKLGSLASDEEFNALKTWSVNKLYALSGLAEDPSLLEVSKDFENKSEASVEDVERAVAERVNHTKEIEEMLESLETRTQSDASADFSRRGTQEKTKKECVKCAKRVGSLATDTHQSLNALVQSMLNNSDELSSNEILEVFDKILRVLRKLRRHVRSLQDRMKPPSGQEVKG